MGRRIEFKGAVTPYVAGQTVKVSFYRDGHKVDVTVAPVLPARNGTGQFGVSFTSRYAGRVQARAVHYATPQQAEFSAHAPSVQIVNVNLGLGSQGQSVRLLQAELDALHYAVPLNGTFEEGTGRALVAYRKMTGLERIPSAGRQVFELLERGAGKFHVRYRGDGRHVEADLTRQVLAEIEPGGKVRTIYTISSGKPSTPTVLGRFRVYMKTPGENSRGDGGLQLLHPRLCHPRLRGSADVCGQPRLPARADPRRGGDLRLGSGRYAGGRLLRGRSRQHRGAQQRRAVGPQLRPAR